MIETQIPGYEIMSVLGRGGMGIVCRAVQASLGRPVALKLLEPRLAADPDFVRRFQQEATTAAALDHPHIVRVYDFGEAGDTYFIAMQLVRGESLDVRLRRGPLSAAEASTLLQQVCAALDYAHRQGVVHRDIKPGNIMIQPNGEAVIMDFGLARACHSPVVTGARVSLGSPGYMAPEQCRGAAVDHRADLYALGVVIFEALTGHRPFSGDNPLAIFYQHVNTPPPPFSQFRANLSPALEEVVLRALEKDVERRYQTAGEFAEAFTQALQHGEERPRPAAPEERRPGGFREFLFRHTHTAGQRTFLALLVIAVLVSGIFGYSIVSRVLGQDNDGKGILSQKPDTPRSRMPAIPSGVEVEEATSTTVLLRWQNAGDSATGFEVERSEDTGKTFDSVATLDGTDSSFTDRKLRPRTQYLYRVRALGAQGATEFSPPVPVTTLALPTKRYAGIEQEVSQFQAKRSGMTAEERVLALGNLKNDLSDLRRDLERERQAGGRITAELKSKVLGLLAYVETYPGQGDRRTATSLLTEALQVNPRNQFAQALKALLEAKQDPWAPAK